MSSLLALDVGERKIGVARASAIAKIAEPLITLQNDGTFADKLNQLIAEHGAETIVVGLPRGMNGQDTAQTAYVKQFMENLNLESTIVFQDEAVTSVMAEQQLKKAGKPYTKEDIDAVAASLILNDYLQEKM